MKITRLGPEDQKDLNRMLKALESDLRITKTEISQLKGMGKRLKELIE